LFLFFVYSQFVRTSPARIAPLSEAVPASLKRLVPLLPYIIIMGTVVVFFRDILGAELNEIYAPIILPVMMLSILCYEKLSVKSLHVFSLTLAPLILYSSYNMAGMQEALNSGNIPTGTSKNELNSLFWELFWRNMLLSVSLILQHLVKKTSAKPHHQPEPGAGEKLESSLRFATNETTGHIGALLILMGMSVSLGGIVERSGMMENLPETFSNIWVAMTILVITMVIIGMTMDPMGAVLLVNATIAPVAFANGIEPLHFWMITLAAFELGYLSPPVALNHLLTRQVVGDEEVESAKVHGGSFYRRHEKYLLPIAVMLTALLMVSYLPLMSDTLHGYMFQKISHGG